MIRTAVVLESAIAIGWGIVLAFLLPYARVQSLPVRIMMITIGYIACFGSLLALKKKKSGTWQDRPTLIWSALVSSFVLLIVTVYEKAKSSTEHLWIALGAVAVAAAASKFRAVPPKFAQVGWLAVIAAGVVLYLIAK